MHQFRGDLLNFSDDAEALEWRQSENIRASLAVPAQIEEIEADLLDD